MHSPSPDALHALEDDVARARDVLDRMTRSRAPLADMRAQHLAVSAALDAAIDAAQAAGRPQRKRLQRLRTLRELHVLAGLSATGVRVPTSVRTTSREATAPHIAGMHLDPTAALGPAQTRRYGLELVTLLDADPAAHADTIATTSAAAARDLPVQRGPAVQESSAAAVRA